MALSKTRVDLSVCSSVWSRIQEGKSKWPFAAIVIVAICWNLWKERNHRIFSDKVQPADGCVFQTYIDFCLWAGQLSDSQRVCISNAEDMYLQDDSPAREVDAGGAMGQGTWRVESSLAFTCREGSALLLLVGWLCASFCCCTSISQKLLSFILYVIWTALDAIIVLVLLTLANGMRRATTPAIVCL